MKTENGNKTCSKIKSLFSAFSFHLSAFGLIVLAVSSSYALTVEEILSLKKAGVSEETIQMLLEREREDKAMALRAGTWKLPDGRVVYSTEGNPSSPQQNQEIYPLCIYPQIDVPRSRKK